MIRKPVQNFNETFAKMCPGKLADTGKPVVKNVTFVVTEDCNLNCTYCYEHHKSRKAMSRGVARRAVDMLYEEDMKEGGYINPANAQAIVLEFIGGEPFLEIDLIDYIVEYFKYQAIQRDHRWKLRYMISISTNGTLYELPEVQEFLRKNKGRCSLTISIDGNKDLHDTCRVFSDGSGSYDIVARAFDKYLKESDFKATKLTLAPQNVSHLFDACKHLYEMGLQDIFANCVFEKGWEAEHARTFYRELIRLADYLLEDERYTRLSNTLFDCTIGQPMKEDDIRNWCGGTGDMLAIGPDGKIYPCLRYMPFSLREGVEPVVIGNVETGIEATTEQAEIINCLNCITRRSQSTDECFNCPIASGCAWCSAYNYEETGTPNKRVTYICIMHKARVLANYYFWSKLHQDSGYKLNLPEEWALEIVSKQEYEKLQQI